jgi:hypothetical protein
MAELRKYGVATTILFPLIDRDAVDFEATPVSFVAADTQISKNEGAFANTGSTPVHEGNGIYSLALTAVEMQAARIVITVIDAATKAWEDQAIVIDTYGDASAQHAFDLDTATQNVNVASLDAGTITAAAIATGAIDADSIATDAITAAKIAADAITSSELATTAVNEIRDAILSDSTAFNGADIATILTNTNGIVAASATGTADSGSTTTMVDAVLTEADTDYWAGSWIRFTSGNISGQTRLITGFTPGSDTVTFFPATTQAVGTNTYEILPSGAIDWNSAWDAEVESEVNDAIDTAISELGVAAPTATPNLRTGLMLLYMALRNKTVVQTSGTDALEIYNDAGTIIASKLLTDDGADYTEAEMS